MIDNRILEAEQELYQGRLLLEKHQYAVSVNKAYRAVLAAAKALLVTEGMDPSTDAETLTEFERRFAGRNVVPASYGNLVAQVADLGPKDTTPDFARAKMEFARGFVEACKSATEQMDKDLKLKTEQGPSDSPRPASQSSPAMAQPMAAASGATVYDLRGVACPMNYVKTKLKLEMMDAGEHLEVWLDAGEPIKNVPMSLRNDGHKILVEEPLEPEAAHFKILVEKVEG